MTQPKTTESTQITSLRTKVQERVAASLAQVAKPRTSRAA